MFTKINNAKRNTVAFATFVKSQHAVNKQYKLQEKVARQHDKMIAASAKKIGPYVPQTCPTQIWA